MLMSKFYNKAKSYANNDPRVITPSSIPIFILPPTLDKIPNHKTELEDTFDCWSLGEDQVESVVNISKEFDDSKRSRISKQQADQASHEESDFVQKKSNQLKSSPLVSASAKSSFKKQFEAIGSLENLVKKPQHKDSTGAESSNLKSFDTSSQSNFQSRNQNSSKSLVKNFFRSGFLSNSVIQDDIDLKENFCNLWVLHGDYKPVPSSKDNAGSQCLKSASVNNLNLKSLVKNEEQLQREHLVNLLSQLQSEEKFFGKKNSKNKYKKEKRSKSETLLTLNSLLSSDLDKVEKCPSRKRSSNLSSRCLNVISTPTKSSYGYFLDVNKSRENSINTDNGSSRRFSFKNLFNRLSHKKSSTLSIDSRFVSDVEKQNALNTETRQKSMSSSITSDSSNQGSKVTPVGSVMKYSQNCKTQSDPMVNRISLSPAKSAKFKSSFKSGHEDDYDKIFSEYLNQSGTRHAEFAEPCNKKSRKKCKNLFKYLFRTKSCGESSVKHRRSRTLDSSIKRKINFFKRNSVKHKMENVTKVPSESELESVKSDGSDLHRHFSLNNCDFFQIEKEAQKKKVSLSKSNETLYIEANLLRNKKPNDKGFLKGLMVKEKIFLKGFIDVSFEKLQQNMKGHVISIDLKNLRVDPLIEINFIKAKLSYLTLELVECDQEPPMSPKQKKLMAKIHKIKVKKCKFDHNLKNLSKPIDFDLVNEHFMSVTEEAMNLQIRKMNASFDQTNSQADTRKSLSKNSTIDGVKKEKKFVFYFNVELHSYIPVSRKILSSTFRKKKRIFKGQCQIHENFISSTQFTKHFVLNEI